MNSEIRIISNIFVVFILISEIRNKEHTNIKIFLPFCQDAMISYFEKPLLAVLHQKYEMMSFETSLMTILFLNHAE